MNPLNNRIMLFFHFFPDILDKSDATNRTMTVYSNLMKLSNYFQFYADCGEVATPNFWYARLDYVHNEKNQILQRFRRSDGGGKHSQVAAHLPKIKNICEIKILRLSS